MMAKRKVFPISNLIPLNVENSRGLIKYDIILPETLIPIRTTVDFGYNATNYREFDFARWYGAGFDSITSACQHQIERFLRRLDGDIEASSVTSYCRGGLRHFFDFMILNVATHDRELSLADIDRSMIENYLSHLRCQKLTRTSQKNFYNQTKSVLHALGRRGLFNLLTFGDAATFPRNPFPHSNLKFSGTSPLPKAVRQAFATALKQAVMPIWKEDVQVTSTLLAYVLLIVALHTGRNTTPLLEMDRDCLRPHPKNNTKFLVLWKRRGHNTSKVALRADSPVERLQESTPTVRSNVERLIQRVIILTEPLVTQAPAALKSRVWLHRTDVVQVLVKSLA
jgi:hypothetical protein